MPVTGLWLRDQSRKLLSCPKAVSPLFSEERTAVFLRREGPFTLRNLGLGRTDLHEGNHEFFLGTRMCRLLERSPCFANTRRWMCATNAYMPKNNANHRESLFPQQGDGSPIAERVFEPFQIDARPDFAAAAVNEAALANNVYKNSASASVQDKATAGIHDSILVQSVSAIANSSFPNQKDMAAHAERNTGDRLSMLEAEEREEASRMRAMGKISASEFQDGNLVGSPSVEGLEDSDVEDGDKDTQLGTLAQAISPRARIVRSELWKLLAEKGWAESTREYLETHHQEISFSFVCKVLSWQKDVGLASSLFQWVCEHMGHDVTVYHAYLKVLVETKRFDEMWDFLVKMKHSGIEVSAITFCIMIRACRVVGELAMAVTVFNRAPDYGISLSCSLHQALLSALFKLNSVREARLFYSRMIREGLTFDIRTFNTLIDGFGLTSSVEDVNKSFDLMLKAGIKTDLSTYNALICAYCNTSTVYSAISVLTELKKGGLFARKKTFNLIVESLCKMGKLNDALKLIASARTVCFPDVSISILLLNGLLSGKQVSKAIEFFHIMEEEGVTNHWVHKLLCNGLQQCIQTTEIQEFLTALNAKHGYSNADVCLALLHNLTSLGDLVEAESLFKRFVDLNAEPNLWAYATMITFYCRLELLDKAWQLLSDLKNRGCKPTPFCYTPMVSALLKASRFAEAMECFKEMQELGHQINDVTCDFLLRELCKHDMIADVPEVLNIILRNKLIVQTPTFFQLIKCMCRAGKIEETKILFRSLCNLKCLSIDRVAYRQASSVIKVMAASTI